MSIIPTNHQWGAINKAKSWFSKVDSQHFVGEAPHFVLAGHAGTGKAQPLDVLVQTIKGPKYMMHICIGDKVLDPTTGGYNTVVGIYPQGKLREYTVTMNDGTSTRCSDDHLWTFLREDGTPVTMPLAKYMGLSTYKKALYTLPMVTPKGPATKAPTGEFSAYLVGRTLCLGKSNLPNKTSKNSRSDGRYIGKDSIFNFSTITFRRKLKKMGLAVIKREKFVPQKFLYGSREFRWGLLQGIMDESHAWYKKPARKNGNTFIHFGHVSENLVDDVQYLIHSFGGVTHKSWVESKQRYILSIWIRRNPFKISKNKWTPFNGTKAQRKIATITAGEMVEQQCIKVDAEHGLYATDYHIVTHNTSCVGAAIENLNLTEKEVQYIAPTGKAAKVLTDKLRDSGWRSSASTIHSYIYTPKGQQADALASQLDKLANHLTFLRSAGVGGTAMPDAPETPEAVNKEMDRVERKLRRAMRTDSPSFMLKDIAEFEHVPRLLVCDEASMVGTELADDLMSLGIPILAIGDQAQLPPVADTWGFRMDNPDAQLTEVHRQAADNPIIRLATMAREGKTLPYGDYGDDVKVVKKKDDDVTLDMDREAMILVGTHKKKWILTSKIRAALGYTESGPMAGEPILICRNSKKVEGMVNGSIYTNLTDHGDLIDGRSSLRLTLQSEDSNVGHETVWATQGLFEELYLKKRGAYTAPTREAHASKVRSEHLDWAHALTVHKSQGSEWDDVVVHDESLMFRDDASRWLYTAITRSSRALTVVG